MTRENLETLMVQFYKKALNDDTLGDFFVIELGADMANEEWQEHIELLVNFWATLFLDEERYKGDPYGPHFSIIGLKKEDFDKWMENFSQTADEIYIPEVSKKLKEKALIFAKEFVKRLHLDTSLNTLKSKVTWE